MFEKCSGQDAVNSVAAHFSDLKLLWLPAMVPMIDRYAGEPSTVFITDRGYESYNVFAHAQKKGFFKRRKRGFETKEKR